MCYGAVSDAQVEAGSVAFGSAVLFVGDAGTGRLSSRDLLQRKEGASLEICVLCILSGASALFVSGESLSRFCGNCRILIDCLIDHSDNNVYNGNM